MFIFLQNINKDLPFSPFQFTNTEIHPISTPRNSNPIVSHPSEDSGMIQIHVHVLHHRGRRRFQLQRQEIPNWRIFERTEFQEQTIMAKLRHHIRAHIHPFHRYQTQKHYPNLVRLNSCNCECIKRNEIQWFDPRFLIIRCRHVRWGEEHTYID